MNGVAGVASSFSHLMTARFLGQEAGLDMRPNSSLHVYTIAAGRSHSVVQLLAPV